VYFKPDPEQSLTAWSSNSTERKFGSKGSRRCTSAARFAPIRLPNQVELLLEISTPSFANISSHYIRHSLEKTNTKPLPRSATMIFLPNGYAIFFETE